MVTDWVINALLHRYAVKVGSGSFDKDVKAIKNSGKNPTSIVPLRACSSVVPKGRPIAHIT